MSTSDFVDYYEILEVAENASDREIANAIKEQQRLWRSRQNSPDLNKRQRAERLMADLADAEKVLLDPGQRRQYDLSRNANRDSQAGSQVADETEDYGAAAEECLEAGQWHRAMALATQGLEHFHSVPSAVTRDRLCFIRGLAALSAGAMHTTTGLESIQEAIRLKPDVAEYYFELAVAYLELEHLEHEDPAQMLDQALMLEPSNRRYLFARAHAHLISDEASLAMPIVEQLLENVDPGYDQSDQSLLHELMAGAIELVCLEKISRRRVLSWEDPSPEYWIASKTQAELMKSEMTRALHHLSEAERLSKGEISSVASIRDRATVLRQKLDVAEDHLKVRVRFRWWRGPALTRREKVLKFVSVIAVVILVSGLANVASIGVGAVPLILISAAVIYKLFLIPGYVESARRFEGLIAYADRQETEFHRGIDHKPIRQFGKL